MDSSVLISSISKINTVKHKLDQHFLDGTPDVSGDVEIVTPAQEKYAEAVDRLNRIRDAVMEAPVGSDVEREIDQAVADYVDEGVKFSGDDKLHAEEVVEIGIAEVAQQQSQPETAKVLADLLDEDDGATVNALHTANDAGADIAEVVRKVEAANEDLHVPDVELVDYYEKNLRNSRYLESPKSEILEEYNREVTELIDLPTESRGGTEIIDETARERKPIFDVTIDEPDIESDTC